MIVNATVDDTQPFNSTCPNAAAFKLLTAEHLGAEIRVKQKDQLQFDSVPFDILYEYSQKVSLILRRALADELQSKLEIRLQQMNIMSLDRQFIK